MILHSFRPSFCFRAKNQLEYILCKCFCVDCRYKFTFCVEISASVLPHSAIICSINQICIFGEHPQFTKFSHTSSNICWWAILTITTYTSSTMISLFWPFQNFLCHLLQMFRLAKGQLISKCPFGIVWTKKQRNYFWISALKFFVPSWGLPGSFLGFLGT